MLVDNEILTKDRPHEDEIYKGFYLRLVKSFSFSYSIIAVVTRLPFPSFFLMFNLEPKMIFVAFFFSDSKLQKQYMYKLLF